MRSRPVGGHRRLPAGVRILVGAGFLVAIGYGIVAPVLPTYARGFGVGITAASTVVSAFAVFRLAFAPASGALVRRLGELWVFCTGLIVVGLSSAACAVAGSFEQLLAFRAVGGIGSTLFTVSSAALLVRISPPTMRGRAAGAWATGFLLGSIGGPLVGGALAGLGPGAPFVAYAVVLGVVVAIAAPALRGSGGRPVRTGQRGARAFPLTTTLRHPTFRAALTANFLNGWTAYGIRVSLVPLFAVDRLGLSTAWSAAALTAFAAGTAATSSLGGRLADRHGRRPIVLCGLAVVGVTMCWFGFTASPATIVVVALVSGGGTGLVATPTNAAVADVVAGRDEARPALAAFQMVGDVGAIAGPLVAGVRADRGGYPLSFGSTAVVVAIACVAWWFATETATRPVVPDDSCEADVELEYGSSFSARSSSTGADDGVRPRCTRPGGW